MNFYKKRLFKAIIFSLLISIIWGVKYDCHNNGRPILTRTRSRPYQLSFQCLCPFDFFGPDCNDHRSLFCLFTNTTLDGYDPERQWA